MLSFKKIETYKLKLSAKRAPWLMAGATGGLLTAVLVLLSTQNLIWSIIALVSGPLLVRVILLPAALRHAARFACAVYGLDPKQQTVDEVIEMLTYRWVGDRPMFLPYVLVKEGALTMGNEIVKQMGGPGGLVLYQDSAVVLEKHGIIARHCGAQVPRPGTVRARLGRD